MLTSLLILSSCKTEELGHGDIQFDEKLVPNSTVAKMMQRVAMNDGSHDNIIDRASCLDVHYPVTIDVNGIQITVNSDADLDLIEAVIDEFSDDTDLITIDFPIDVTLSDHTDVTVTDLSQLNDLARDCPGDNVVDDDIECVDYVFPLTVSFFNETNDVIRTLTITEDGALFELIDDLNDDAIIAIGFPITLILWDGSLVEIESLRELQNFIEGVINACDEDDDNDFNDDDCGDCTVNVLRDILVGCGNWTVDRLELDGSDLEDDYVDYVFNFGADGGLTSSGPGGVTGTGTWSATGSGNHIEVTLNITDLQDFNATWNLHEIEQEPGEVKVDLRLGDNRLRFESDCTD